VAKNQSPRVEPIARLQERIDSLVATRQELRARGASPAELESNRLELSNRQRQLSCAFLERALPGSSGCRTAEVWLAHKRLAA